MRILKTAVLAFAAAGLVGGAATFTSAPAKAQGVSVDIGGPAVRYRDRDDDWRYRHRYRAETYGSGCRTIIRREWRGDHEVVIRRRVCD